MQALCNNSSSILLRSGIYGRKWMALFSTHPVMDSQIELTKEEEKVRLLLLDTSNYIGDVEEITKPELRFCGGWVRDRLLGLSSKDIDVGISSMTGYRFGESMERYWATPEGRKEYGRDVLGKITKIKANPEKSKHLETATLKVFGLDVDLVNLRKEIYKENSRIPDTEFGSPKVDAQRRDATINALFYNLTTKTIEDFTGTGLKDMELKIIRTPLSPYQTFKDDPLRILRCIRFASKLGYRIDAEAEQSMSEASIKKRLRDMELISRERIGSEVEKMLKGSHPHTALSFIDRLGLYDTIFTDPTNLESISVDTANWSLAYDQLWKIAKAATTDDPTSSALCSIESILLRDDREKYLAWLLGALVPWAKITKTTGARSSPPIAAIVVREGLKAENKVIKVVENAVLHQTEIKSFKDSFIDQGLPEISPIKRKHAFLSRGSLGMAMRRWGSDWRSSVLFSILVDVTGAGGEPARQIVVAQYASWLRNLQSLELLEVCQIKPLVDGKRLQKALNIEVGPWMKKGLEMALEWQLQNPNDNNPENGVAEVLLRKEELRLS